MQRTSFKHMECPAARALERVGEWWSILILRDAFHGLSRFDEFQTSLGIAPNILTRRLKHLTENGLLERCRYNERTPRYEYRLTPQGRDFFPVLAALTAADLQHLNAHATSTPLGDRGELEAIKAVFGRKWRIAVTSTKSATGHMLGAAGGIEAIFAVLALRDHLVPASLNLQNPDPAADGVDLVSGKPRPMAIEHALSNGFGFGGVNASIVLRRWQD